MSTLRINNIEAQSIPASPTIDEKVKVTNSSGDILVNIDGKTSGITTIGINTTDGNIKFDANSNILIAGILTATTLSGNFTPTSLEVGSNIKLGNAGVITATRFVGSVGTFTGDTAISGSLQVADTIQHEGDVNTKIRFPANDTITAETSGVERLRITSDGRLLMGVTTSQQADANLQVFRAATTSRITFGNINTSASGIAGIDFCPSNKVMGSRIECQASEDFSTSANRTADLVFFTRQDGTSSEKLRILSSGEVVVGGTSSQASDAVTLMPDGEVTAAGFYFSNNIGSAMNACGIRRHTTNTMVFDTASTERLRIDSSGRIGVGIVPQASQYSGWTVLQVGESAALTSNRTTGDTNTTELSNNSYLNSNASAYKYHHTDEATRYNQSHGRHTWYTAASGSADATISYTEVMKIDASGYVTKPTTAAFNVKGSNMTRNDTSGYICQFNNVTSSGCFDSGNNFNTSTYKFVAPVSGHYYFFTNIRLDSFNSGYIRTAFLSTSYGSGSTYWSIPSTGHVIDYYHHITNILHISASTVMYVPATHEVWVYQDPSSDSSYTCYLNESSFGGYLIG